MARRRRTPRNSTPRSRSRSRIEDRKALVILLAFFVAVVAVALWLWILSSAETQVLLEPSEIFHNPDSFHMEYKKMEKSMKIFVYNSSDIGTIEPSQAHLFLIPLSCYKMHAKGIDTEKMTSIIKDYIHKISVKYVYWNKSSGADHFFVTCIEAGVKARNAFWLLRGTQSEFSVHNTTEPH